MTTQPTSSSPRASGAGVHAGAAKGAPSLLPEHIKALAKDVDGAQPDAAVELVPHATLRSFRVGDVVLRVDEDPNGKALDVESMVLTAMATAARSPIVPELVASSMFAGKRALAGAERSWLAYRWLPGRTLDKDGARTRSGDIGIAFAHLHGAHVFDLLARLPVERPLTLLESFRKIAEGLRAWTLTRELDGLGQDLLTLTLSDLQRALRQLTIAQDHLFLTARRRVVCHGRPEPSLVVGRTEGDGPAAALVVFDAACKGDAAEDLAAFSVAADLDEDAEDRMLRAYLDEMEDQDRLETRFIPRFFARRALALLAAPVLRLEQIARIKKGDGKLLGDPVVAIEEHTRLCYEELARAINGLRDLVGKMRPVSVMEVMAMGRLIAFEEMILRGRQFRIAVTGLPYSGKTEVGSLLARRLQHAYVNTGALARALALVERRVKEEGSVPLTPRALVKVLFERGFKMTAVAEPPFYRAQLGGEDVTEELHAGEDQVRAGQLLDEEIVRATLRDELAKLFEADGIVVEGHYSASLMPGRVRHFHLTGDKGVRRARLMSHRADLKNDDDAEVLLEQLDNGQPALPPDATVVDVGSRPAAAATLEILWNLLPPGRRPTGFSTDLSGRAPLYP